MIEHKVLKFALGAWLLACAFPAIAGKPDIDKQSTTQLLKGEVRDFGVLTEDLQNDLGLKVIKADGRLSIEKVRLGTEAYYRGLQEGDHILKAEVVGNQVLISIDRAGKVYTASLTHLGAGQKYQASVPKTASALIEPKSNKAVVEQASSQVRQVDVASLKALSSRHLDIIVDRSLSMNTTDCPSGLTRYKWCAQQAAELTTVLTPYSPKEITIIPFDSEFKIYENLNPAQIVALFNELKPRFGTYLAEPLVYCFQKYFAQAKTDPLLIAVMTDGCPYPKPEPAMVKAELIKATANMRSSDQVAVVFFQIGASDAEGEAYLEDLDNNLVKSGARYPIVRTVTFSELQTVGLARALADAIRDSEAGSQHAASK